MKRLFLILTVVFVAQACESPADVDLRSAIPTMVVDAFINNLNEDQQITLNFSQDFLNDTAYQPVEGAVVTVVNEADNVTLGFTESSTPGVYVWSPSNQRPTIGAVGDDFTLVIQFEGNRYVSTTTLNRSTPVEEILFYEEEEPFSGDKFYEARVTASDPEGVGDSYWFKTYWNGEFLGRPGEINIAFDAGLSSGNTIDGQLFIFPIRIGINPTGDDESYELNDVVRVEIHSISNEAFDYFTLLQIQTDRPGGFSELFAQPLANLPSNVSVESSSEHQVLGYFSVSAVEELEVVFTEDLIRVSED